MQALQTNLDGKSKQYKDPALTHLFLMNNIHDIVRSVRRYVMYILSEFFFKSWMIFLPVNTGASLISVFQVRSQGFVRGRLGAKTQEDWAATCKSIQKECLGKGNILLNETTSESSVDMSHFLVFHWSVSGKIILSSYL